MKKNNKNNFEKKPEYMGLVFGDILLIIFSIFNTDSSLNPIILALFGAQILGTCLCEYFQNKKKSYLLLISALGLLLAIYGSIQFFNIQ